MKDTDKDTWLLELAERKLRERKGWNGLELEWDLNETVLEWDIMDWLEETGRKGD